MPQLAPMIELGARARVRGAKDEASPLGVLPRATLTKILNKDAGSDPRKLEEVTHGSDPRWVTSAPGGPKNLLIDHHNNNAAVARSARRKKSSF